MQIYDDSKKKIGTLTNFKDRKIVKTLDSGDKELTFKYPANGKQVGLLKVEHYIRTKEDEFVLRAVKTGSEFNEYTAQLNVEELETQAFPYGFESQEQDIRSCLEFAFEGTGWTVGECSITKKRTINFDKPATAWDVLQQCLSTYRVECKIDTINKRIDIYEQIGSDKGCYFVEGLNLRKLTVNSDTYDFYTRLIPLGKDGINIEWLTGKLYLENYQYSSKVKTIVWKDERYTNTTSLIEDGTTKLEEMSKPYRVFSADVVDLARQNKRYKNILDFDIGDTVLMISRRTKSREKQRIVKITMYPETPQKNTVELSNTTKTFAEVQQAELERSQTEAVDIATSSAKKILRDGYYTKEEVESHITASADAVSLGVSKIYETKAVVEEKIQGVNKRTDEKLTEYSTTEEMQAAIDLKADQINLSVSKTYATTTTVTEKFNSAVQKGQQAADAAEAAANKATDEKLTEYSTTEEMQAAIDLKADQINLSVSKTYATTSTVTEKFNSAVQKGQQAADAAEAAANANTTNRLKNYSTTTQMNAAIKAKADEITLEVNKKVDSSEFGTKISQNAYYVRVAWNGNSKYIQFENGGISMYDGAVETSKRRAIFNYSGEHFYRDGYYVGKIGTNQWSSNNAHKGLVFDLEAQGKYMTWARKKSASDDTYTTILCYSRANSIYDKEGLHLGCNLYGNNFDAYGLDLHDSSANGYSVTEGKRVPIITSIKSNADGTISWTYSSFTVRNGMITSVPDSSTSI